MANEMMWAYMVHLSNHWWDDPLSAPRGPYIEKAWKDENEIDLDVWDQVVKAAAEYKFNTLIIDVCDGIQYETHPEISAPDAWSKDFMKKKLDEIRALGITPIPKLNFSTCHDAWLKDYGRMVSTPKYYQVVADLIKEVCELFDYPRLFHLGMDEEDWKNQRYFEMVTIRGEQLWWHDLYFFFDECAKHGARPWVWSDYFWDHPDAFAKRMPKSVLQSNWFYRAFQDYDDDPRRKTILTTYEKLDKLGYDQIPTVSTIVERNNPFQTAMHCREVLNPDLVKGILTVPWIKTVEENKYIMLYDADALYQARKKVYPETLK